ncbi:hypothetical protein QE400_000080 [Xanthomonas sacchari]|uniref:DUF2786 domain-containing protein n=1 Tax=Xanthomonas sacchari TaxID=56458 RepID=UPI00277D5176|nr:DUF2786 domain-containing protein [Xanthomonas sacchari]MDQ1090667.1 hypothetical protein [Xanthomonas sacchari]
MNKQDALRKLQACLRMATSSNPHEQAAALRHARKLMDAYGLTEEEALAAEYVSVSAPTRQRSTTLPRYLSGLARMVGDNFACVFLVVRRERSVSIEFVGKPVCAKLAGYAFTVLRRQLEAAAAAHIARVRRPDTRRRRRELFAEGWVVAVRALLAPPPLSEQDEARALASIRARYGEPAVVGSRETAQPRGERATEAALNDMVAGYGAGRRARLHIGVENAQDAAAVTQLKLGHG